jgi:hypothetical protein
MKDMDRLTIFGDGCWELIIAARMYVSCSLHSTIRAERKGPVASFTNQLDGIYVSVLGSREN